MRISLISGIYCLQRSPISDRLSALTDLGGLLGTAKELQSLKKWLTKNASEKSRFTSSDLLTAVSENWEPTLKTWWTPKNPPRPTWELPQHRMETGTNKIENWSYDWNKRSDLWHELFVGSLVLHEFDELYQQFFLPIAEFGAFGIFPFERRIVFMPLSFTVSVRVTQSVSEEQLIASILNLEIGHQQINQEIKLVAVYFK